MKITLLIAFVTISLFAGNPGKPELQYKYASGLMNQGNYFEAITEFKRLLFSDSTAQYKYEAYMGIGASYKKGNFLDNAGNAFAMAELATKQKEKKFEASVELSKIRILQRDKRSALETLNRSTEHASSQDELNRVKSLLGWNHIFAGEWDSAAVLFNAGMDTSLARYALEIEDKRYSVTLSRMLSIFLPGAGQFYTGNYISGVLSLGWHVLWGYDVITAIGAERMFDALMVANFLWLRFYNGNVYNAELFAEENNRRIDDEAIIHLLDSFEGETP